MYRYVCVLVPVSVHGLLTTIQSGLYHLVCGTSSTLRILDISGCRGIQFSPKDLHAITSNLSLLRHLIISYYHLGPKQSMPSPSLSSSSSQPPKEQQATEKNDLLYAFASCKALVTLTVDDVTEEGSNRILIELCGILTSLRLLILIRKSYESDFMFGMYADLNKGAYRIDDAWVKEFNQHFASRGLVAEIKTVRTCLVPVFVFWRMGKVVNVFYLMIGVKVYFDRVM